MCLLEYGILLKQVQAPRDIPTYRPFAYIFGENKNILSIFELRE